MVEKVISPESKDPRIEVNYDDWVDKNFKIVCESKGVTHEYLNRYGYPTNNYEFNEVVKSLTNLAAINYNSSHLTNLGEIVKSVGGWLKYLEIEEERKRIEEERRKVKDQVELNLAISNIEANKLNVKNAEQNIKDSRFNKIFLIINAVFAALNILVAILQWWKPVK